MISLAGKRVELKDSGQRGWVQGASGGQVYVDFGRGDRRWVDVDEVREIEGGSDEQQS